MLCTVMESMSKMTCSQFIRQFFVLDAPTQFWVKCIKPLNEYNSCEWCEIKFIHELGRVIMTELCAQLRHDRKFLELQ